MSKLIYDYWFVQFDFPDASGKLYKSSGGKMVYNEALKREIPDGWGVDIVNNIINVKDGTHDSPKPTTEGYHLITSKNLKVEGLDFESANLISKADYESVNTRSKVDAGDILFSMIGSIGVIYKVDEENINFAIKNVALYKTSEKEEYRNYIYMFLKSYDMQRYMGNVISGSIQKFIGLGALRNMPILLDEDMIIRFESTTAHIFKKLTLIKRENQKLVELRDWLLPMLMNGQITVKD
jgi:type I restriction enzyme S subunit